MLKICVLVATFNRIQLTDKFLSSFLGKSNSQITYSIVVVDNNSMDGTYLLLDKFSSSLDLSFISTPRDMFWAEAMRFGHDWMLSMGLKFDFLVAANDDLEFRENWFTDFYTLCINDKSYFENSVVAFSVLDKAGASVTYGAQKCVSKYCRSVLRPMNSVKEWSRCDSFNMNFVVFSNSVLNQIGFIDDCFVHSLGDFDLGLRCSRRGFSIWCAPTHVGYCNRNVVNGTAFDLSLNICQRISVALKPKNFPLKPLAIYCFRHSGMIGIFHLLWIYLSIIFPVLKNLSFRKFFA